MIKFSKLVPSLVHASRYTFIPPSCYDIQAKPNPIVCVTLGNNDGAFCDLHFRVSEILYSYLKTLYPKPLKIIKDFFWALENSKIEI